MPATFFCHRLLNLDVMLSNFSFVRDCMLRVGRDFTTCLKSVGEFVTQYRAVMSDEDSLRVIGQWAQQLLAAHAKRGHDLEVSWALVICGILGVKVSKTFMDLEERSVSPVVLAMLGLLSETGFLAEPWDEWKTPIPGTGSIANGRYWLPHYEAVLREWTGDSTIIAEIKADPLFSRLLKAKVSFLDDSDFLKPASKVTEKLPPEQLIGKNIARIAARTQVKSKRRKSPDTYD